MPWRSTLRAYHARQRWPLKSSRLASVSRNRSACPPSSAADEMWRQEMCCDAAARLMSNSNRSDSVLHLLRGCAENPTSGSRQDAVQSLEQVLRSACRLGLPFEAGSRLRCYRCAPPQQDFTRESKLHAAARMPWYIEQHGTKLLSLEHIDMLYDTYEQDKHVVLLCLPPRGFENPGK